MSAHHTPPTWFILGQRGSGKSTLMHALCAHWRARRCTLFVVDPVRDFSVPPAPGARYRVPLAVDAVSGPAPGWDALAMGAEDCAKRADQRRPGILVVDDLNRCAQGPHPQSGVPEAARFLVHEGRHVNAGYCVSVRLPGEVPNFWRSEATHRAVFLLTEPGPLAYCRDMGLQPRDVDSLPRGAFWHRAGGGAWHRHDSAIDAAGQLMACLRDPP